MGLFKKRKRRSTRKAEKQALKHKAKVEAKQSVRKAAKLDRKRFKAEKKSTKKIEKAQISALKAQEKASEKQAEKAAKDPFSPGQVKKYLGVARVLAPVLAPVVYRGATMVRGQIDAKRAQRFGVGVDELGKYTGHGAKLTARIANAENSTAELIGKRSDSETQAFAEATRGRLTDLHSAASAAEQMPTTRRKAAHQAIGKELDGIEADLLARRGVR